MRDREWHLQETLSRGLLLFPPLSVSCLEDYFSATLSEVCFVEKVIRAQLMMWWLHSGPSSKTLFILQPYEHFYQSSFLLKSDIYPIILREQRAAVVGREKDTLENIPAICCDVFLSCHFLFFWLLFFSSFGQCALK